MFNRLFQFARRCDLWGGGLARLVALVLVCAAPLTAAAETGFSGRVTDLAQAPLAGVQVRLLDLNGVPVADTVETQADGSYLVGGLGAGQYKVSFLKQTDITDTTPAVYYRHKMVLAEADVVTIQSDLVTPGIDAVIGSWGVIAGKVVNAAGAPIQGIAVTVCDPTGQALASVPAALTDAGGAYALAPVPQGAGYRVRFGGNSQYAPQWYGGAPLPADAIPVSVEASLKTSLANATLPAISLAGRVSNASGAGLAGIQVYLYDASSNPLSSVISQADGSWLMSGLAAGSYKVGFLDPTAFYLRQYYNKKSDRFSADPISVVAGAPLTGLNATLITGPPTVSSFTVPATASSLTVSGIAVVASEPSVVAGYLLTESAVAPSASAAGWSASAPTSYTFASAGTKTLYAWAKGITGLVSAGVSRTVTLSISYTLSVQTAGTGSGAVNSSPAGIACASGSTSGCSASLSGSVTLSATPSAGSSFAGWSGACTGTGSCLATLSSNKSVTATFTKADPCRIGVTGYQTLQAAYDSAAGGALIQVLEGTQVGSLTAAGNKTVTVGGGYDASYSAVTGESVLDGQLKVRGGKLYVKKLKVK